MRRRNLAALAALPAAAAVISLSACGGSGQPSPLDILHADGYSNAAPLSTQQLQAMAGVSLARYVSSGGVGTSGGRMEIVLQLTPAGVRYATPRVGPSSSTHMDGNDLVMVENS